MRPPIVVPLRKVDAPGKRALWILELTINQATLRDETGALRNAFTPASAGAEWLLPSFSDNVKYVHMPIETGPARFGYTRPGLRVIRDFVRSGAPDDAQKQVRILERKALRSLAIGVVCLGIGVLLTALSILNTIHGSTSAFSFGTLFVGIAQFAQAGYYWREAGRIANLHAADSAPSSHVERAPQPAQRPVVLAAPRRGRGPIAKLFIALGAVLVVLVGIGIYAIAMSSIPQPSPRAHPRPAQALASPSGGLDQPKPLTPVPPPIVAHPGHPAAATNPSIPVIASSREPVSTPEPIAELITFSGAIRPIEPPASVRAGELVDARSAVIFFESARRRLTAPLRCDAARPGTYRTDSPRAPIQIAAGRTVNVFFVHANTSGPVAHLTASVTFPSEILGLIYAARSLDSTDGVLGRPGVAYPTGGPRRGFFDGDHDDLLTISADRRTLGFTSHTGRWVDQIRVVTAAP